MSDDDEWPFPAPLEDPEIRGANRGRDKGAPRLIPDENIVEGQTEEDGRKDGPSCPFSH
ncbi:MAG TPA: hypothetical protein VF535_03295 [Allosphingosinicella sp.]|jgi:hypothetical protein